MQMTKKLLTLVMALIITVCLTACSQGATDLTVTDPDALLESTEDSGQNQINSGDTIPEFDKTFDIEETDLTNTYDVNITATKLSYSNSSVTLSLRIENKSDMNREVYAGTSGYGCNSVNGYMIHDGYMWCQLEPGATEEDEISFSYDELYAHGITVIADIGVGFDVSDDDYHHEYSGMITIKTNKAANYNYVEDTYAVTMKGHSLQNAYGITIDAFYEDEAYSEAGVSIISQALVTNKSGDSKLMLEVNNESEHDLYVKLTGLTINDQEVSTSYLAADLVCSQKRDIVSISLNKYFEDNDSLSVQSIHSISFDLGLNNMDGTTLIQPQTVTIAF